MLTHGETWIEAANNVIRKRKIHSMDTTLIHHWIRWIHWRSIVFTKFICAMPNLLQTYIFTTFWSLLVRHFEPTTHCVYFKYVEWLYFSSSLHLRDEYLTFIESCIHTQYACLCTNTDTHLATNEERKKIYTCLTLLKFDTSVSHFTPLRLHFWRRSQLHLPKIVISASSEVFRELFLQEWK